MFDGLDFLSKNFKIRDEVKCLIDGVIVSKTKLAFKRWFNKNMRNGLDVITVTNDGCCVYKAVDPATFKYRDVIHVRNPRFKNKEN